MLPVDKKCLKCGEIELHTPNAGTCNCGGELVDYKEPSMSELFVLFRHDTQQWYHSLTVRGYPTWVDTIEQAQYLTEEEAERVKNMWYQNPYKNVLEILPR